MTKKDIALLLSPGLFFAVVAVAAFFTAEMIEQRSKDDGGHQKFLTFVSNVQSGKWQLSTDRWLEGMRRADATAEAYRKADASTVAMFRDFAWTALAGMALQAAVVYSVLKRVRKTMPNKSLQATATAPVSRTSL